MPENTSGSPPDRKRIGVHSRGLHRAAIGQFVSGRSREGRFLRAFERQLLDHVGGAPSAVERALITRAARLALFVELLDERALAAGGGMTEHDSAQYLAWSSALTRTLARIGLKGAPPHVPTLAELMADAERERHAAERARQTPDEAA